MAAGEWRGQVPNTLRDRRAAAITSLAQLDPAGADHL
jgi:hypothetical protein